MEVRGNIVDVINRRIYKGKIKYEGPKIINITEQENNEDVFIMPGFVDAHIHVESSMLTPYYFAQEAVKHGTVATISDPHEIANVNGMQGVEYMLENAKTSALKIHFGAPSCVPATSFETAGAILDADAVQALLQRPDIWYLSEMMNYPGVLYNDAEVMAKIKHAHKIGKPVDGHAPGLRGEQAAKYIAAGITTDHECFTLDEAIDKLKLQMKVLIREGSAAKNFEALHPVISSYTDMVMLCSDDKHPDDFLLGHINKVAARAIASGHKLFDVLQCACVNPVLHYNVPVGLLRTGDAADFIVVSDLKNFDVIQTVINGNVVYKKNETQLVKAQQSIINNFDTTYKSITDFVMEPYSDTQKKYYCIEALEGQLITNKLLFEPTVYYNNLVSNTATDILKIVVVNRYSNTKPAVAFIKNFGLKEGAIASTVAHDSHNIIAVGVSDDDITKAVNLLIECRGGISVVANKKAEVLPLPIAGLMSVDDCATVGKQYVFIDSKVKEMGCTLRAPYMTLSFMALLVIPSLKLSDKGLFDGEKFEFC
nr:adenine deaminase [Bacteroidota bacterium]